MPVAVYKNPEIHLHKYFPVLHFAPDVLTDGQRMKRFGAVFKMGKKIYALGMATLFLMAGCSTTSSDSASSAPIQDGLSRSSGTGQTSAVADETMTGTRLSEHAASAQSANANKGTDAGNAIDRAVKAEANKSIFFDFDSFDVQSKYNPIIEIHGKYLRAHRDKKAVIQGNTDDRGGSEYNLALGQRRAEAVRKRLVLSGVNPDQLDAISYGKEKPKARGNDEAARAQNRRADIVY